MSQKHLATLAYLQGQTNLMPQQQQVLQQLQVQYQAAKQAQARVQEQQSLPSFQSGFEGYNGQDEAEDDFAEKLLKDIKAKATANKDEETGGNDVEMTPVGEAAKEEGAATKQESVNGHPVAISTPVPQPAPPEFPKVSLMDVPVDVHQISDASELGVEVDMRAADIAERCRLWVRANTSASFAPVFGRSTPPPAVPNAHSTPKAPTSSSSTSKDQLLPPTPSVHLENKKDAFSPQLQHFCLEHPIAVIRGIAAALKLDLGLFSTKSVSETHPGQAMHVATQIKQKSDENLDPATGKQIWMMESRRGK